MANYQNALSRDKVLQIINDRRKVSLDISGYFNQAWEMVQKDMGNYVGFGAVSMIISGIIGLVPYIGNILSNIANAILNPGFSIFTFKKISKQNPDFNDFFEGTKSAGPLVAIAFITIFITLLIIAPVFIPFAFIYDFDSGQMDEPSVLLIILLIVFMLIAFVLLFYLVTSWVFAPQLVIFANMSPWEAMEASRKVVSVNFWSIFLLLLLGGIVSLIGMIALCIGLFWAIPTVHTANYLAFEDVFRLREGLEDDTDEILEHLI